MPSIEYSPSGRATCRGCFSKIQKGEVRVGITHDEMISYFHAPCYANKKGGRKDFTKFVGWNALKASDKRNYGPKITKITPVAGLGLHLDHWKIQAQVESKSEIRHWNNARGAGCLFNVELIDASGVDIKATFFQKDAVDKFYELLQVGQTFTLAGGTLKAANQQYNTCKSPYEITFNADADIEQTEPSSAKPIALPYEFCASIASLKDLLRQQQKTVDVIAVVADADEEPTTITKENRSELVRRHVTLVDQSGCSILWTLWGAAAKEESPRMGAVVAVRHARLSDFGGVSLSGGTNWKDVTSTEQAQLLKGWWDANYETALMNASPLTILGEPAASPAVNKEQEPTESEKKQSASAAGAKRKIEEGSSQPDEKQSKQTENSENSATA